VHPDVRQVDQVEVRLVRLATVRLWPVRASASAGQDPVAKNKNLI
jgi:hypothetical protein